MPPIVPFRPTELVWAAWAVRVVRATGDGQEDGGRSRPARGELLPPEPLPADGAELDHFGEPSNFTPEIKKNKFHKNLCYATTNILFNNYFIIYSTNI